MANGGRDLSFTSRIAARLGLPLFRSISGDSSEEEEEEEEASVSPEESHEPLDHALAQVTKMATTPNDQTLKRIKAKNGKTINSVAMIAGREINVSGRGRFSRAEAMHMAVRFLPKNDIKLIGKEHSRLYVGQFSTNGAFFVAGYQDKRILIFDVENNWSVRKKVVARNLTWTVTDTALSPDQRFLVYSSITPIVHLVNVGKENAGIESLANVTDIHEGLQLSRGDIGIWSLKFSHDGSEILAGATDCNIHVYDLNACKTTFRVEAHSDEVNAVAFTDESSHLLFSGSDDNLCRVWDRRCFSSSQRCVGQLIGHLGGITFIDSRGDGRHCISNSKDQSIKLWDIRKMSPPTKSPSLPLVSQWDYRYMKFPENMRKCKHADDGSIMTYKGHEVLRTLIRCYFSPAESTGQKFIYTGSSDGSIYIYDLVTGNVVERLRHHRAVVRDCSWHPWQPMLVSTCWNGAMVKWEYSDEETPVEKMRQMSYPRGTYVILHDSDEDDSS